MTNTHSHHHDHGHASGGHHHEAPSPDDAVAMLDLDAAVLHDYWAAALDLVAAAAPVAVGRALDLGAGTGVGAIGLAQRFGSAEVVALDLVPESLQRINVKAAEAGVAERVSTLEADLDAGWPETGTFDVTWASMSLHHMGNPLQVLRDVRAHTRSGGLLAVAEFETPLRFLPDDLGVGSAGFEERTSEILNAAHEELMPTMRSRWAPRIIEAGWEVIDERDITIDIGPVDDAGLRYAEAWFRRTSAGVTEKLAAEDRATLAALLDPDSPHSLLRRTDVHIRGVRTVTLARG